MMLDHPASSRHLPAGIEVSDGSQPGEKGVDQRQAGENQKNTALQREILACCWAFDGRNHSSRV